MDNSNYTKKYLQFNSLVFSGSDVFTSASLSGGFKGDTSEYFMDHGSYFKNTLKSQHRYAKEQALSLELTLPFLDFGCLDAIEVTAYKMFIMEQLSKVGKLWALDAVGRLIWTTAFVTDWDEQLQLYPSGNGKYNISVDLILPEGIWHDADYKTTFIKHYCINDFWDFTKLAECGQASVCDDDCEHCRTCNLCESCEKPGQSICDIVDENGKNFLVDEYFKCKNGLRVTDICQGTQMVPTKDFWGYKYPGSTECGPRVIQFYYSSNLATYDWMITLVGCFKDATISLNGKKWQIQGEYDGVIQIHSSGNVTFSPNKDNNVICQEDITDKLVICDFNAPIVPGKNLLIVDGICDNTEYDVYIKYDRISY